MKVLLINGSPHKNGSTGTVLGTIAETLGENGVQADIYHIGSDPVAPCRACRACSGGKCVINDKVNGFLDFAAEFDGYIIGSPVHFASSSGNLIPFLDRAFFVDHCSGAHSFWHKPGSAVAVARRAGTTATIDQLNKYFLINQMPVISGRYWNMVFGATPEDVRKDLEGMQNMRFLAKNFAYFLRCREAAEKAGIFPPENEEILYTNFIR